MNSTIMQLVENHSYQQLFINHLHWGAPDLKPLAFVDEESAKTLTITNVSSFKGIRVWTCPSRPGARIEAAIDRMVGKSSVDRLVIFYETDRQIWRWPARKVRDSSTITRLTRHLYINGSHNPRFEARLESVRLPVDQVLDANSVLARVRAAFDLEIKNETKQASLLMARMYGALEKAYLSTPSTPRVREHEISVTLARMLFLMFGDDTEMWDADLFYNFIYSFTSSDGSDLGSSLNTLFGHLNDPEANATGEASLASFPYVNGGLFEETIELPKVGADFRSAVLDACVVDWSSISPAIFGSMFQSVRDAITRRELGEHYTSEENILRTLNPLFLDELRAEFDRACGRDTQRKQALALHKLWDRLSKIRYLDPACGCGNFIIVAYRELRGLELQIMEKLQEIDASSQLSFDPTLSLRVTLDKFFGIEIDEWPAKIAETAMFLIDRQCDLRLKERFGEAPKRLPIQMQAAIRSASPKDADCGNALRLDWRTLLDPDEYTIVAGNPPFLGKEQRSASQTDDMRAAWGSAYSGEADYVTAWFAKTSDFFGDVPGRWAFVSTNSVVQGGVVASVFGKLFGQGWRIAFAHRTFEWTSEAAGGAAVHCVIVGFRRGYEGRCRLFDYPTPRSTAVEIDAATINGYLVDGADVLVKDRRRALSPQLESDIRFGSMAADAGGLFLNVSQFESVQQSDPIASKYLRLFVGAKELLHSASRYCIWMPEANWSDIRNSRFLSERCKVVEHFRSTKAKDAGVRAAASTPYRFCRVQQPAEPYICIPRHVTDLYPYYPVARYEPTVISGDANFVMSDPDGFYFALLSSAMFMVWQRTVGGRIKNDPRFASTVTWNTFPLPVLTNDQRNAICQAGATILVARAKHPSRSLAQHYGTASLETSLQLAHQEVDTLVDLAMGAGRALDTERERQELLFDRYQQAIRDDQASGRK